MGYMVYTDNNTDSHYVMSEEKIVGLIDNGKEVLIALDDRGVVIYDAIEEEGYWYELYSDINRAKLDYEDESYEHQEDGGLYELRGEKAVKEIIVTTMEYFGE